MRRLPHVTSEYRSPVTSSANGRNAGEILDVYRGLEVVFPWQAGDVMLVDNVATAHGRNPYQGERKLLVALGQMTSFEEVEARQGDGAWSRI